MDFSFHPLKARFLGTQSNLKKPRLASLVKERELEMVCFCSNLCLVERSRVTGSKTNHHESRWFILAAFMVR